MIHTVTPKLTLKTAQIWKKGARQDGAKYV